MFLVWSFCVDEPTLKCSSNGEAEHECRLCTSLINSGIMCILLHSVAIIESLLDVEHLCRLLIDLIVECDISTFIYNYSIVITSGTDTLEKCA